MGILLEIAQRAWERSGSDTDTECSNPVEPPELPVVKLETPKDPFEPFDNLHRSALAGTLPPGPIKLLDRPWVTITSPASFVLVTLAECHEILRTERDRHYIWRNVLEERLATLSALANQLRI